MRCRPLLAVLLLMMLVADLPAQGVAASAGQVFTIDHYAKVARVSDVRVSPAGDRAVMVVAWPNYESNAWESELVQVDLRTRNQRTMTQRKTASSPR